MWFSHLICERNEMFTLLSALCLKIHTYVATKKILMLMVREISSIFFYFFLVSVFLYPFNITYDSIYLLIFNWPLRMCSEVNDWNVQYS